VKSTDLPSSKKTVSEVETAEGDEESEDDDGILGKYQASKNK
jgi:hypothetical protein